jgi:dihydrofolate reductase
VGPLHEWCFSGDNPITDGGDQQFDHSGVGSRFKVSSASAPYVRAMWDGIGVIVMGRRLFDLVNGWEGHPPAGDHVVVVPTGPSRRTGTPRASYHFVNNVGAAVDKAKQLAGQRDVVVNAGEVGSQILAAGEIDEVAMEPTMSPHTRGSCSTRTAS